MYWNRYVKFNQNKFVFKKKCSCDNVHFTEILIFQSSDINSKSYKTFKDLLRDTEWHAHNTFTPQIAQIIWAV